MDFKKVVFLVNINNTTPTRININLSGRIIKKNQMIKQVIHITRDSGHTNKEIINKITRGNLILLINE